MIYSIWNNKGGVGKTFVSFIVATEYAIDHPNENIIVVDMCPQANVSEILLGGNGAGASELANCLSKSPRHSIGGYLDERIARPHSKTGNEPQYLVNLNRVNPELPSNLWLVPGDPSLELQAQAINQIAAQTLPEDAWKNVHSWLIDLVEEIQTELGDSTVFIDCNPSFSAYTELALLAAERLIVPCSADGSSARAISNVGQLLYGLNIPAGYGNVNFHTRATNSRMRLPSIHLVPLNRSTQYDKKASKAFKAMYDEIKKRVNALHHSVPTHFSNGQSDCFIDIPDAHSVSVVCSHYGIPLRNLRIKKYDVHGTSTQVNSEPLDRYKAAVANLIGSL